MTSMTKLLGCAAVMMIGTASAGCIKTGPVAVVDNRTALEIQASGEYPVLEFESADAVLEPGPIPVSGKTIVSEAGLAAAGENLDLFADSLSDERFIDAMLLSGCLGEAEDGLLEYLPNRCDADVEVSEIFHAASRNNLHRRQIWEYLASKSKSRSAADARDAWRSVHLEQVRCGAWVEEDGAWAQKAC